MEATKESNIHILGLMTSDDIICSDVYTEENYRLQATVGATI